MSIEVRCIIADANSEFEEVLSARSLETAKEDLQTILDSFNSSLRPGELPRRLIRVIGEKTVADKSIGDKLKDFHSFLGCLHREQQNVAGSAWLKAKFSLIMKAYDTLLNTGKSRMLNKYVVECFVNVRSIAERLQYLKDVDIVALFQETKKIGGGRNE